MKKIYLSLDLDYFNLAEQNCIMEVLETIEQSGIPYKVVRDHHHLLKHISHKKFTHVINVDWHSDLADDDKGGKPPKLDCGTWGNRVHCRSKAEFWWIYPAKKCWSYWEGFCHGENPKHNPFRHKLTKWKRTEALRVSAEGLIKWLDCLGWENIKEIGITISPEWTYQEPLDAFRSWLPKKTYMKYRKREWLPAWSAGHSAY